MPSLGPIPAHAGQPSRRRRSSRPARAYPRSRGATAILGLPPRCARGLSPLTRGNPGSRGAFVAALGPIPAHAGQPSRPARRAPGRRAYPRSRGATTYLAVTCTVWWGLSPLTRGNLQITAPLTGPAGPIPAHAGQPRNASLATRAQRAYPRSRGATERLGWTTRRSTGLSPLTRGNHQRTTVPHRADGPIPAHAGQPAGMTRVTEVSGAYPRSRGATPIDSANPPDPTGLSPLTRGNRTGDRILQLLLGPIPAHAGQPA